MSENEFWGFLEKLSEKGRAQQVIGAIGCTDSPVYDYMQGHAVLPKDYDQIREGNIIKMGKLLLLRNTTCKAKETIMIILAHQPSEVALNFLTKYCLAPDKGLEFFAQMALEECAMWNE